MTSTFDPPLDLQTIRIVRAIADTGTITGAARLLGYSQPAVSQHVQRAEARLNVPLVTRVGRSVRLTEAGMVLARHALTITSALEAASGDLADLAGLRTGTVRMAAFPTASSTIVPRLLATMASEHPGVRVNYVEAQPPEAVAMLREGSIDLAITFSYPGDRSDPHVDSASGLGSETLFTEDTVVVLAAGHPLADHPVVDLTGLSDERWIAGCPRCRGHLLAVCELAGFAPAIAFETDNASAVINMVASGLGVAMLPRLALVAAAVPPGVVIRRHSPASERSIHLIANDGARRVPSLAATSRVLHGLHGDDWGLVTV
ncbi:LysR family transcriptional regulator [Frigoribacterium sp. CG_9.8]|uniref:LysR family transcriptional regulator n=1 Tax=Frigoribacterium sp. CG_9.8 TaxID=2787733 RepID=UPI0018CB70D5|nr:LysR family transcriptional regulator [Frigoribacterium sp. CG_9.8]MBG6107357.1 DNA-binding transcriptional LysR family regulator [Frigoribacterium sp. CG_9.8]